MSDAIVGACRDCGSRLFSATRAVANLDKFLRSVAEKLMCVGIFVDGEVALKVPANSRICDNTLGGGVAGRPGCRTCECHRVARGEGFVCCVDHGFVHFCRDAHRFTNLAGIPLQIDGAFVHFFIKFFIFRRQVRAGVSGCLHSCLALCAGAVERSGTKLGSGERVLRCPMLWTEMMRARQVKVR